MVPVQLSCEMCEGGVRGVCVGVPCVGVSHLLPGVHTLTCSGLRSDSEGWTS